MKKFYYIIFYILCFVKVHSQSQSELLKNFSAKSLFPASVTNNTQKEIKAKEWPINIEVSGSSVTKITLLRAAVLEEIFQPDVPKQSSYFFNTETRVCFYNGIFHYYKVSSGGILLLYILADSKEKLQNYDVSKAENSLVDYFEQLRTQQKGAKETLVADIEATKEKERLENSLKGKNIKSMEVVWLTKDSETGLQSKIQFGVKATDANGKVFSTDNLGGKTAWDDFVITSIGAVPGDEYLTVETDASKIINNKVSVTVKNKHQSSISTSSSIKMSYVTPVKLDYWGKSGCPPLTSGTGTRGYPGSDVSINVCNSADNEYVLAEVNVSSTSAIHKIKVKKGVLLQIDVTGGPGCSGHSVNSGQGGKGGDGNRGGDVTVNKSASLSGDNIVIYNKGGKGGKGGKGKPYEGPSGSNGTDGTINYNTKTIQLNF